MPRGVRISQEQRTQGRMEESQRRAACSLTSEESEMLTDKQRDVLDAVRRWTYDHPDDIDRDDWARCVDIGGWDASHHSRTVNQLRKRGFVVRRRVAGHWRYRAIMAPSHSDPCPSPPPTSVPSESSVVEN